MADLELFLLGPFRATLNGEALTRFRSDNARILLAYLAVHAGDHFDRLFLARLLWPDHANEDARANLRQTLFRLNRFLAGPADEPPFLLVAHNSLAFNRASPCTVDVTEFSRLLDATETHIHDSLQSCADCMRRLHTAVELYRGDFLAGLDVPGRSNLDGWRLLTQEQLHSQALTALEHLASYYEAQSDHRQAATVLQRLLALEPWREEEHRRLMQALALDGRPAAALEQFETCASALAAELGAEPEADTKALAEDIREGRFPGPAQMEGPGALEIPSAAPTPAATPVSAEELAASRLPQTEFLYGRKAEEAKVKGWLGSGHQRLVSILGMGGIGKTALAVRIARAWLPERDASASSADEDRQKPTFRRVLWRSLVNAPPLTHVLSEWLQVFDGQGTGTIPASWTDQLILLIAHLAREPALLVLDNLESVLEQGEGSGHFRAGYEAYEHLLRVVAEREHASCLLLTSRESPHVLGQLERSHTSVQSLHLPGLPPAAGRRILARWALRGDDAALDALCRRYSGNPLALELVSETIDDLYDGDVAAFLELPFAIFESVEDVLAQQFERLTEMERRLLHWLAVEREPRTAADLAHNLNGGEPREVVLTALRRLQHRSLLERQGGADGAQFYLQNVITEYVTNRLVGVVCEEIREARVQLLESHALLKATAEPYVVESQQRMILQPVIRRLRQRYGGEELGHRLRTMVTGLQESPAAGRGYAAGNLLNLMLFAGMHVQGMDFSGLTLRQAHLSNARLPKVNLTGSSLQGCSFTEAMGKVMGAALSPDNRLLAAVTVLGELLLWEHHSHQQLIHHALNVAGFWSVAFSPDGRHLVCAAGDGRLYCWHMLVKEEEIELVATQILSGHERVVRSVAFRPDGGQLASGGEDGSVRLWSVSAPAPEIAPFQMEYSLKGHTDRVFRVVYSPDGRTLASAGADTEIRLWDTATGECLWTLRGHTERIAGLAFSPDGKTLVSGGVDRAIRIWSTASGACVRVLRHHRHPLLAVAFSPDGRLLASAGHSTSVQLWDATTWQPIRRYQVAPGGHPEVWVLLFDAEGKELITAGDIAPVSGWDLRDGQSTFVVQNWRSEIYRACFHPPGRWLIASDRSGQLLFWDGHKSEQKHPVLTHRIGNSAVLGIAFAAQGTLVISATLSGSIRLLRLTESDGMIGVESVQELPTVARGLGHLTLTGDERFLVAVNGWGDLFIWRASPQSMLNPHPLHRIRAHTQAAFGLSVHPQGQLAATGGDDRVVRLWEIATGAALGEFSGFHDRVVSVDFSPDGSHLAASDATGTVLLWAMTENRISHRCDLPVNGANVLKFVANRLLAVGGQSDISLWRLEADGSMTCTQRLSGHSALIQDLQRHPTRPLLISASNDGTVRLWNLQSGECTAVWRNPGPYQGTNIHGVRGLTPAQRANLLALGAVEEG